MASIRKFPELPAAFNGLQVNCCRNVLCPNFGNIPIFKIQGYSKLKNSEPYKMSGDKSNFNIECNLCGTYSRVKSNKAIFEEFERIQNEWMGERSETNNLACPEEECSAEGAEVVHKHGVTKSGSPRYRCTKCGKTFVIAPITNRKPKRPEISELVFRLLINKMPMRRICETAAIQPATLYGKIDLIHKRCVAFTHHAETIWRANPKVNRIYLSLDRQEYIFNWGTQLDRTNTKFTSITSVDNRTSYVFSLSLDFDPNLNADEVEAEAVKIDDYSLPYAYRNYSRLWLLRDYSDTAMLSQRLIRHRHSGTIEGKTADKYRAMLTAADNASDLDVIEAPSGRRPSLGMQVRSEYTIYGHMFFLAEMLKNVEKVRFFMDREAAVFPAFSAAFGNKIVNRSADAFFVRMKKNLTVDQRKLIKAAAKIKLNKWSEKHPEVPAKSIAHAALREILSQHLAEGSLNGVWIAHPLSDMAEPEKEISYLTDLGTYDIDHLAHLYNMASLKGVDRFLMQIRRRLSIFERPIHTSNSQGRTWHGYSGYNPAIGAKLLAIFRTAYNFSIAGQDGVTPAMRLGLSNHVVSLSEILSFSQPPS